jgi:CRISPR system Cascade subunit CasA
MAVTFNLIDQPWLTCRLGGRTMPLGIRDVLQRAHDIQELRDASPLVTIAAHRLLLAILHRALNGPETGDDWESLWKKKRFDHALIDAYLEKWRGRFDLFDARFPFYQDPAFEPKSRNAVNQIVRELARGNNATLFDHSHEHPPPIVAPNVAACALIAEQALAVGGGKSELGYTSSAPAAGGVLFLVLGNSLFETLLLNLMGSAELDFPGGPDDVPYWERCTSPTKDGPAPLGYLDYLTWQSRTIRLFPEAAGGVRTVAYAAGRKFEPSSVKARFDPMMAYTRDEADEALPARPIRLTEAHDLWRDSAALFQFAKSGQYRPPRNLAWVRARWEDGQIDRRTFALAAVGLSTDKAKVNFWRHDNLPLPLAYLHDDELVECLHVAIAMAEAIGKAIRVAAATTARFILVGDTGRNPDKNRLWQIVDSLGADSLFWSRVEPEFRNFMPGLATDPARDTDLAESRRQRLFGWYTTLSFLAKRAFRDSARPRMRSDRERHGVSEGEAQLQRDVARLGREYQVTQTQEVSG